MLDRAPQTWIVFLPRKIWRFTMLSCSTRKHIDCKSKRSCARKMFGLSGTGNDGGITGAKTVLAGPWVSG